MNSGPGRTVVPGRRTPFARVLGFPPTQGVNVGLKVMSLREAAARLCMGEKTLRLHLNRLGGVDRLGRPLFRRTSAATNAPWRISEEQLRLIWESLPAPRPGVRPATSRSRSLSPEAAHREAQDLIATRLGRRR